MEMARNTMAMLIEAPTFASTLIFMMMFKDPAVELEASWVLPGAAENLEDWEGATVAVFITDADWVEETAEATGEVATKDVTEKAVPSTTDAGWVEVTIEVVPKKVVPSEVVEVGVESDLCCCEDETTAADDGCSVIDASWGITSWKRVDTEIAVSPDAFILAAAPSQSFKPEGGVGSGDLSGGNWGRKDSATLVDIGRYLDDVDEWLVFDPIWGVRVHDWPPQLFPSLDSCEGRWERSPDIEYTVLL
jgi:hypothetical protein